MFERRAIAIVGLSCRYPGSSDAKALWENVLASRRQFRRIPDCRFPLSDYYDPHARDKTYATRVAVMDWKHFDWEAHGISRATYESTDSVHWLALQVALEALEDAGYSKDTLPRHKTGVILGNTLCGEETRTWGIRLRWPFIARALREAAERSGLAEGATERVVDQTEALIKSIFPALTEDSLSGSMASTIAGRIASHLDLDGGGYIVDGACSSSLIAVATAADRLSREELDLAIVGGVDISLDPLELIGFSGAGALTRGEMNVYDRRASGFLPGEGCGVVLLRRLEDAERDGDVIHAVLRGWGISSDGRGAIAAPNSIGQSKAILRAYEGSGYSARDLDFVEGHGTGTPVGDRAELEAVYSAIRTDRDAAPASCGITSLKSLVGHTKAAAGIGGLIKAVLAVNQRVLPPTAGCASPHVLFEVTAPRLYPLTRGEVRAPETTMRAGISAMGFGGINCHLTVESHGAPDPRFKATLDEERLLYSSQETELFLFGGATREALLERMAAVRDDAVGASLAELTDLASELATDLEGQSPRFRVAAVAHTPEALVSAIDKARAILAEQPGDDVHHVSVDRRLIVRTASAPARVGMVFPGQGAQQLNVGLLLVKRLPWAREMLSRADGWMDEIGAPRLSPLLFRSLAPARKEDLDRWRAELTETSVAQPAICFGSLLFTRLLKELGLEADAVAGHSLGELSAFAAAGAFDDEALLKLAALRGRAMSGRDGEAGAMASLMCDAERASLILAEVSGYAVIANMNTPLQTVVSGEVSAIEDAVRVAEAQGVVGKRLPVSNAFHSRMVAPAAAFLRAHSPVEGPPHALLRPIFSGMTGEAVSPDVELSGYFAEQVLARVDFISTLRAVDRECDLILEVGPGRILSGMAVDVLGENGAMCLPVESSGGSDRDLNIALGAVFAHGHDLRWSALFEGRLVRPFVPVRARSFFVNPCERPFAAEEPRVGARPPAVIDASWAESLGVPASFLGAYLADRGDLVNAVVRADVLRVPGAIEDPAASVSTEDAGLAEDAATAVSEDEATAVVEDAKSEIFREWHPSGPARQGTEIEDSIIEVIAGRMECALENIDAEARLRDDLGLDDAEAVELVRFAAEFSDVEGLVDVSHGLDGTIHEVASAVRRARQQRLSARSTRVASEPKESDEATEAWNTARVLILADAELGDPIAAALSAALTAKGARVHVLPYSAGDAVGRARFSHVFAVVPRLVARPTPSGEALAKAVDRLREAARVSSGPDRFTRSRDNLLALIEVGEGLEAGASSFGASLHLERPGQRVRVLEMAASLSTASIVERTLCEAEAPEAFLASVHDDSGARLEARPEADRSARAPRELAWSRHDVLWVTGGARGRTAECALAFARATGVRLAVVDRLGHPIDERTRTVEIRKNMRRFAEAGVVAEFFDCDVEDLLAVRRAVTRAGEVLGPITAVLHGLEAPRAGAPAERVTRAAARSQVTSAVEGMNNVMRALEGPRLSLFAITTSTARLRGFEGGAFAAVAHALAAARLEAFSKETGTPVLSVAFGPDLERAAEAGVNSERFVELMRREHPFADFVIHAEPAPEAEPVVASSASVVPSAGVEPALGEDASQVASASWPLEARDTPAGRGLQFASQLGFTEQLTAQILGQLAPPRVSGVGEGEAWHSRRVELTLLAYARPGDSVEGEIRVAEHPDERPELELWADLHGVGQDGRRTPLARADVHLTAGPPGRPGATATGAPSGLNGMAPRPRVVARREVEVQSGSPERALERLAVWLARARDRFLLEVAPSSMSAVSEAGLFAEHLELELFERMPELDGRGRLLVELAVVSVDSERLVVEASYRAAGDTTPEREAAEGGAASARAASPLLARARQSLTWRASAGTPLAAPPGERGSERLLPESLVAAIAAAASRAPRDKERAEGTEAPETQATDGAEAPRRRVLAS